MLKLFTVLTTLTLATPAMATPVGIVNPKEPMVVVPGLEFIGPSRLSTVEFCQKSEGTNHWTQLQTDSDLELMEGCLIEQT